MIWSSLCNELLSLQQFLSSCYISQDLPVTRFSLELFSFADQGRIHFSFGVDSTVPFIAYLYYYWFSLLFFESLESKIHTLLISIFLLSKIVSGT